MLATRTIILHSLLSLISVSSPSTLSWPVLLHLNLSAKPDRVSSTRCSFFSTPSNTSVPHTVHWARYGLLFHSANCYCSYCSRECVCKSSFMASNEPTTLFGSGPVLTSPGAVSGHWSTFSSSIHSSQVRGGDLQRSIDAFEGLLALGWFEPAKKLSLNILLPFSTITLGC